MDLIKENAAVLAGVLNEQKLIIHNLERMLELIQNGAPCDLVLTVELEKWKERHLCTLEHAGVVKS